MVRCIVSSTLMQKSLPTRCGTNLRAVDRPLRRMHVLARDRGTSSTMNLLSLPRSARALAWVCLAIGFTGLLAWQLLKSDTIARPSASFMTMTQALSPAMEVARKCWAEQHLGVTGCGAIKANLPMSPSTNTRYFVTNQGALIGVDHASGVIVVLTPRIDGGKLSWQCAGSPPEVLTKACDPL